MFPDSTGLKITNEILPKKDKAGVLTHLTGRLIQTTAIKTVSLAKRTDTQINVGARIQKQTHKSTTYSFL
jgi:hypothetical protein